MSAHPVGEKPWQPGGDPLGCGRQEWKDWDPRPSKEAFGVSAGVAVQMEWMEVVSSWQRAVSSQD